LIETCARHTHWTRNYYAQVWCQDQPFWQERAAAFDGFANSNATLTEKDQNLWMAHREESTHLLQFKQRQASIDDPNTAKNPIELPHHAKRIRMHHAVEFVEMPCVIEDKVQRCPAIIHPNLDRPVAFLSNHALVPALDTLRQQACVADLLQALSNSMPSNNAESSFAWLWQQGLLEVAED